MFKIYLGTIKSILYKNCTYPYLFIRLMTTTI